MISKKKRPYDPESLPPERRLRANLEDLFSRNELSGTRVAELANDVNRLTPHVLRNLTGPEGHNTARRLRGRFMQKSTWMPDYVATIRTWNPKTHKVVPEKVPMQLLHEVVTVLHKHGFLAPLLAKDNLDPLTLEHLLHCEKDAGCELLGIGLWGDGAPTQWDRNETIDVLSVSFPGLQGEFKGLRVPLVVLPHSRVCSETWDDVFEIIKWSLIVLATGRWPTCRHDGSDWNDTDKCRKTARPFPRGALCEVRQDWKFATEVFGFPAHNTAEGNCWACKCTPEKVPGGVCKALLLHLYVSRICLANPHHNFFCFKEVPKPPHIFRRCLGTSYVYVDVYTFICACMGVHDAPG